MSFTTEKGTGGLDKIKKLESTTGWIEFIKQISLYLSMNGYGDLLKRNAKRPEQGALSERAYETKLDTWLDKQERACSIIRSRLGYNATREVKEIENADKILTKLQKRFRPTGSAVYQCLERRYQEVTLDTCTGVMNYAEKLREARTEIIELDPDCMISEISLVSKFLTGLGPDYDIFLTSFHQKHSLLPERDEKNEITKAAVTFDEAIQAAEREEQNMKGREDNKTALLAISQNTQKTTKGCEYCHKLYHTKDRCWDLHPELKRKYHNEKYGERKRKRSDSNSKENKKLKGKSDEPMEENEIEPLVGLSYSISDSIEAIHLMAADIDINLTATFFLDSGCSHHSGCRKEDFTELRSYTGRPLRGFAGARAIPEAIGTMKLSCLVDNKNVDLYLHNTLYVPEGGVNLISMSKLRAKGAKMGFDDDDITITIKGTKFKASLLHGLYAFDI